MGKLDRLYASAPVWVQNAMVSGYGAYWHWARFGGGYKQHERGYRQREWFGREEWDAYQAQQIKKLLAVCVSHVPYYKQKWNEHEKSCAERGELRELPLLEKEALRINVDVFHREDLHPWPKQVFHTSGTTGTPIATRFTLSELRNSMALREVRSAKWAGVSFKQARATFSGRLVEPNPSSDTSVYRYNTAEKQVYFSAFHLKPETARLYVEALRIHKVVWMTGYAVSFYLLAKFILEQEIDVPRLKAVITTSEKLSPEMRGVMEEAYHCKIYEEYSTVENALFASECEQGNLHVSPDAGVVEILRPNGSACKPGEVGEVVTTCLLRDYQPLIRFRLGDLAAWDAEPCGCGRAMPVIKEVVGRIEDVVVGPDGRQMVRFHGIFVKQPHVVEGQVIQESLHEITVKVLPTEDFGEEDRIDITQRIKQRLGSDVTVRVELVKEIPRTKSGKFQAVISHLERH